jgi:hypothetical protein
MHAGSGGEVYLYANQQPGTTVKFCYRHAVEPTRTLFYRSYQTTAAHSGGGGPTCLASALSGGEVWAAAGALSPCVHDDRLCRHKWGPMPLRVCGAFLWPSNCRNSVP